MPKHYPYQVFQEVEVTLEGGVFWIFQATQLLDEKVKNGFDLVDVLVWGLWSEYSKYVSYAASHQELHVSRRVTQVIVVSKVDCQGGVLRVLGVIFSLKICKTKLWAMCDDTVQEFRAINNFLRNFKCCT